MQPASDRSFALQTWVRRLAWAHALTRTTAGLALLLAPKLTAHQWLGREVQQGGGKVALQAFAVRDAALGLGMVRSLYREEPVRHWFRMGVAFELVDGGATVLNRRDLPHGPVPGAWALLGLVGFAGGAIIAVFMDE